MSTFVTVRHWKFRVSFTTRNPKLRLKGSIHSYSTNTTSQFNWALKNPNPIVTNYRSLGKPIEGEALKIAKQTARKVGVPIYMHLGHLFSISKGKKFNPMYRTHYSEEAREEYRGQTYKDQDGNDDYRIPLVVDFNTFSNDKYVPVAKRGMPKCTIKDFSTGYIAEDANGKERLEFNVATVDGELINEENAHKFLTSGSTIKRMYIHMGTTSKSQQGISTRQEVIEMVVQSQQGSGEMDRIDDDDEDEDLSQFQRKERDDATKANNGDTNDTNDTDDTDDTSDVLKQLANAVPSA